MRLNIHPDQHTYITLSDHDEIKVTKKIVELARAGRFGDYRRDGGCVAMTSGEDARITNLALVRLDEMEEQANKYHEEIK